MEERNERGDTKEMVRQKKLVIFSQLHRQYTFEQEKVMRIINTLLDNMHTEPYLHDKLDEEISKLSSIHSKMQEIESFMLQIKAKEIVSESKEESDK